MHTVILGANQAAAIAQLPSQAGLPIDKAAEIDFVRRLISQCWNSVSGFSRIDFGKKGYDIELIGAQGRIRFELKASNYKADYFNKNGTPQYLYGNCLKPKDIDLQTGLLRADFLVFAALVGTGFDFWLFSRDDLATLYPRSPSFIPSFIPTLMIEAPAHGAKQGSHFNDDFNLFKKGVYCIILPLYDVSTGTWSTAYPSGKYHSFLNTWCPLIDEEYQELSKVVFSKLPNRCSLTSIFTYRNSSQSNPHFGPRVCYYRLQTIKPQCSLCKATVGSITRL
jgi:hypothetical protein